MTKPQIGVITAMSKPFRIALGALVVLAAVFLFVPDSFAQSAGDVVVPGPGDLAPQPDGPVAIGVNLWLIVIGVGVRFLMYLFNHNVPFLRTEPQKQVATAIAGAIAGAMYQVLGDGNFGANDATLSAVLQATLFTLVAHNLVYAPGQINLLLGGGTNRNGDPSE